MSIVHFGDFLDFVSNRTQSTPLFEGKIHTKDFACFVLKVGNILTENGLKKGDKVALIGGNSSFWLACDLAIMSLGLVCVPMFDNASISNLQYQINEIQPKAIILTNNQPVEYDFLKEYLVLTQSSFKSAKDSPIAKVNISPDDLATIVYTSGTGGLPKGVMISHKNLISQILDASEKFGLNNTDTALAFLPMAHIYQRMISYVYLFCGVDTWFIDDPKAILDHLPKIRPTVFVTVPRLLEKIFAGIKEKVSRQNGIAKILAKSAFNYALEHNSDQKHHLIYKLWVRVLYQKIIDKTGGRVRMIVCGGAALDEKIYNFMTNIGLNIYVGYGLTESSPVIAANYPKCHKKGTVGRLFSDVECRIAEDGELFVRGPNVTLGYFNDENLTQQIYFNNWLKTGDLASLDGDGFLTIRGRKKEQFKTSTGKYINPVKLEAILNAISGVEMSCAVADGKKFVSAIIFPSEKSLTGIDSFKSLVEAEVFRINQNLEPHEQIKRFWIANALPSIETGELTPSNKLRRGFIYQKYADIIDSFYE